MVEALAIWLASSEDKELRLDITAGDHLCRDHLCPRGGNKRVRASPSKKVTRVITLVPSSGLESHTSSGARTAQA